MDFQLSEEQQALQEVAREFLKERWPTDSVREALDHPPARIDPPVWEEIVSMGWLGVAAPEEAGGIGGDIVTAAVLAEEAGRAVLPGPLISSLVACIAVERSDEKDLRESLLADLVMGRTRATLAVEEAGGGFGPASVRAEAVPEGDGWAVSGLKILVPDTEDADLLLVAARTPHGTGLVRVPADSAGVTVTPMRRLDAQSIAEVRLEGVRVPAEALLGGAARGVATLEETYDVWTTLLAADLLGSAAVALEMTTQYATERIQFGRPIGSFQAVSHRLADTLVDVEIARSLVYAAGLALDERRPSAPAFVSAAKAWAGETAVRASEAALQLHGGTGYTWEIDVHLHLRRARANAVTLGDADAHRDRVAAHLDGEYGRAAEAAGSGAPERETR